MSSSSFSSLAEKTAQHPLEQSNMEDPGVQQAGLPDAAKDERVADEAQSVDLEAKQSDKEESNHGSPLGRTRTAQDWDGPNDPENPQNWPTWKKVYHTSVPALMGLAATLGSSIYTPGIPEIMSEFQISSTVALLGLATWVLGLAFGPILAAPLSETRGRLAVYRTSLPIAALFSLGSGFARSPAALIVTRFFGGFFSAPVLAVGGGTVADIWKPVQQAPAVVLFVSSPFAGPAFGPIIGGFVAENKGWRWTQWGLVIAMVITVVYSLPMSETHKRTILRKRAEREHIDPPAQQGPSGKAALKQFVVMTVLRPIHMLTTEPIVGFFSLYIAFNFSVIFAFFDAFPIVFQGLYGLNRGFAGLIWIAVLVGVFLGVVTFISIDRFTYRRHHAEALKNRTDGLVAPERRLYAAMYGSIGLPIGLFWMAWTARSSIPWISPALAAIPFAWGNILVFTACCVYLMDTYGPRTGASALAANGFLRYVSGAVFPLFTNQMYARLGIGWATSLLGFIAVALLPIPWILFKYGSAVRRKSKYETIKI